MITFYYKTNINYTMYMVE